MPYGEAVSIRCTKINLGRKQLRLGAAQTKNGELRIASLADEIASRLRKMFRSSGRVISAQNFREEWEKACVKVGLGAWTCEACDTARAHMHCPSCKKRGRCSYSGLTFHDSGRSAVRKLADTSVRGKAAISTSGTKLGRSATAITS